MAFEALRRLLRRAAPLVPDRKRWIVLDLESSGLDPRRDRLLSIAALALDARAPDRPPLLCIEDSFEAILRPAEPARASASRDDILVHGIGLGAQAQGMDMAPTLEAFERYVADSPLLGFHSGFDQALLGRHMKQALGRRLRNPWVDIEQVAAVLRKQARHASLDEWIRRLGLQCEARHLAAADALVTAELLLVLWPLLQQRGLDHWDGIARVASEARFLPGRD